MYIKSLVAAIAGLTVAGAAVAGGHDPAVHAPVAQNSQVAAMSAMAQGNSVWPAHTMKLAGGKLTVGGMANLDGYWSSKTNYGNVPMMFGPSAGGSASAIYIHNANLFLGGDMGMAHARINMGYFDNQVASGTGTTDLGDVSGRDKFTVDEAYVTFSNFAKSPFYVKAGKAYEHFGSYNAYAIVPTLTQLFTEVKGTGVEVGYAGANGFHADVAGFSGDYTDTNAVTQRKRVDNFTVNAGYQGMMSGADWGLNLGYLHDARDLNYTAEHITVVSGLATLDKTSVFDANAHMAMNNFDAHVDFARFNDNHTATVGTTTITFEKPWTLGVGVGYKFNTMNYASHVGISYQKSKKAAYMGIPKTRYTADYSVAINKNVNVMLAYYHDKGYGLTFTGINSVNKNNMVAARVSVSF